MNMLKGAKFNKEQPQTLSTRWC